MKTLIVGAGVAGLTLAALMAQRGETPLLVERETEADFNASGYMLGIVPLGGRVLNALGLRDDYLAQSCDMRTYRVRDGTGKPLKTYPLDPIIERYGPYRGISRTDLIALLRSRTGDVPVRHGTRVEAIDQGRDGARVRFSDGSEDVFDLVVVAEGLHSATRKLVLGETGFAYRETGWGGWVTWIDADTSGPQTYEEHWADGWFMGRYPVRDRIGVFLGGVTGRIRERGPAGHARAVRAALRDPDERTLAGLDAFETTADPFFWDFHDCRSESWVKGKAVLIGDAAAGFLPTAGLGATMAMDTAAALADELSRASLENLDYALILFTRRQRHKVEIAQKSSRDLGRFMFVDGVLKTFLRDRMLRFYSLDMLVKSMREIMEGPAKGSH